MTASFGFRLRHVMDIYAHKVATGAAIPGTIDNWQMHLKETYGRCVHDNLIDMRQPLQALAEHRQNQPVLPSMEDIYADLDASMVFADAASKKASVRISEIERLLERTGKTVPQSQLQPRQS